MRENLEALGLSEGGGGRSGRRRRRGFERRFEREFCGVEEIGAERGRRRVEERERGEGMRKSVIVR